MKTSRLLCVFVLIFTDLGCTNIHAINTAETRVFLNDYALSKEGADDQAIVGVLKKDVAWAAYKKVVLAPIMVKVKPDSGLNRVAHAEKAQLQEMLEFRVRESLKPMFKLVNGPGVDTLRMELAITDSESVDALKAEFESGRPAANYLLGLNSVLSGTDAFTGKSSIRGRIIDSTTGDLLMVVADQADDALPDDFMLIWKNAGKHYKYWARQLGYQLCLYQKHHYCQQP